MESSLSSKVRSVLDGIREGKSVPPIILTPYGKTGYYIIIDGRHRVASSIIVGNNYIPAHIHSI